MGRASLDLHVEPDEPLVGEGDFEVARLGDDGRVGGEGLQHLLGARAAVLLVRDTREEDVAAQPPPAVARVAATIMAAMPPFMSKVPRPYILPSLTRGASGSPS